MLGSGRYATRRLRQLSAGQLAVEEGRSGVDPIPVQVVQGLAGGDAAGPHKRQSGDVVLREVPHEFPTAMNGPTTSGACPVSPRNSPYAVHSKDYPAAD